MKKPELLAPAGHFECLEAAINAGADAIYLAGQEFGARASAQNFTEEELIKGLELAHVNGKKIYLTLNTLIKEREWYLLENFLRPLYNHGLDGVIIQDLGLIDYLKRDFPNLELHGSTQMTITGSYGAKILKKNGLSRVVPARELSLEEITDIRNDADIEVEAFIHGAMCYCYSGQCLFSSYLGGRSGNRGRCAQPCRLSYAVMKDNKYIKKNDVSYPLSLKDMCTIKCIDKLIDAGIDSFKIEGRLKRPEYVAGVTSIYRKYIDLYCDKGFIDIDDSDIDVLSKLYVRSQLSEGYYFRHNGVEMITKTNPSYNEADDVIRDKYNRQFVHSVAKKGVYGVATLVVGEPASLIVKYNDVLVSVEGETVLQAQNRPLTEEDVQKQLSKTGDSLFEFDKLEIQMDNNCFMPVKHLNELRRMAFEKLKEAIVDGK